MVDRDWEDPERMISVDDALARIVSRFEPLPPVATPIIEAVGMVLAEDVVASQDVPPFRNSAMDGYAVRAGDTGGACVERPALLKVVGTVAAGSVGERHVQEGEAIRIMTGAPLPAGADTIVRFEETDELDRRSEPVLEPIIGVRRAMRPGENVREPGEDIHSGTAVLTAGRHLQPGDIGILATLNRATARVHRRPRVAILSTGDEVVDLGPELAPGQIRNSNSYTIASMVRSFGGEPVLLGVARDTTDDLIEKLRAAGRPDLYVTSGGVSLGDYDMVKDVLRQEGEVEIWQVRMKPGKPLAFGQVGGVPLLGLPGNPAAAFVSFQQFGRPAILKMLGRSDIQIPEVEARLAERVENKGMRRHFERGVLRQGAGGLEVRTTGIHGSAMLSAVIQSNCLIVIPEDKTVVETGSTVRVQLYDSVSYPFLSNGGLDWAGAG